MDIEHIPEQDDPVEDPKFYDFSVPDLDNSKEAQEQRQKQAEYEKMISDSISIVTDAFHAEKTNEKDLSQFLLYQGIKDPTIKATYQGKWKNRDIHFCKFTYETIIPGGKYSPSRSVYFPYFVGVIDLEKNYPQTIAQPETLALKIEALFNGLDIDFDLSKKFSRKFYVISKDRSALEMLLFDKDLDRIAAYPETEFEFNGRQCYFRANRNAVTIDEAENFVELAKILAEVL